MRQSPSVVALLLVSFAACSANDPVDEPGAGGSSSAAGTGSLGGSGNMAGQTNTAGMPTAGSSAAGAGTSGAGGSSAGAGGTPSGGTSSGGMAGASGSAVGGQGGASGGAGGGGGTAGSGGSSGGMVKPSAGCGKSGRPANGKVQVANEKIIDFPASYDGMKPFPLLVALHACGNPNTQWENLTKSSALETDYVRLMPNTTDSGQCWSNYNNNITRIRQQYDDVKANYCIDENRVFGIGHSSGAQMLVNILSHKSDADYLKFKGVAPVAADPFNVAVPIPVLYIAGKSDTQRGAQSAPNTMQKFRAANMCADTSKPYSAIQGCKSSDGPDVNPGCIVYDQCSVPTIWCSHNDPSYSNTNHGVPCFAVKSMVDFFKSL